MSDPKTFCLGNRLRFTFGPRWARLELFGLSLYIKQHTYPGNGLFFSQRNGYTGKVVGPFYLSCVKPSERYF